MLGAYFLKLNYPLYIIISSYHLRMCLSYMSFFLLKLYEAYLRRLHARIAYAKFLQETAQEMAREIKQTAEDHDGFLNKVNNTLGPFNLLIIVVYILFLLSCFVCTSHLNHHSEHYML